MYVCIYVHAAFQVNDKVWVGGSSLKSPLGADSYAINFLFGCQTTETGRHAFTFTQTHIDANTYIHYHTYMHAYILCIIHTNSTCIVQYIYTHTYIHTYIHTYCTYIHDDYNEVMQKKQLFLSYCLEKGLFRTQLADGIMGMAMNDDTLPYQLQRQGVTQTKVFALCFRMGGGIFTLGPISLICIHTYIHTYIQYLHTQYTQYL